MLYEVITKFKYSTGKFDWAYKGQLQSQYTNYYSSEDGQIPDVGHRHKFSVKYERKKNFVNPSMGIEYYFSLSPAKDVGEWKQRWYVSLEKDFTKRTSGSLSYRRQTEYNVAEPEIVNVLYFGIEYKLDKKKKK